MTSDKHYRLMTKRYVIFSRLERNRTLNFDIIIFNVHILLVSIETSFLCEQFDENDIERSIISCSVDLLLKIFKFYNGENLNKNVTKEPYVYAKQCMRAISKSHHHA